MQTTAPSDQHSSSMQALRKQTLVVNSRYHLPSRLIRRSLKPFRPALRLARTLMVRSRLLKQLRANWTGSIVSFKARSKYADFCLNLIQIIRMLVVQLENKRVDINLLYEKAEQASCCHQGLLKVRLRLFTGQTLSDLRKIELAKGVAHLGTKETS